MADFRSVDTATLEIAANLILKHLANSETPVEARIYRKDAAKFLQDLARDSNRLKEALRPGTVGK